MSKKLGVQPDRSDHLESAICPGCENRVILVATPRLFSLTALLCCGIMLDVLPTVGMDALNSLGTG